MSAIRQYKSALQQRMNHAVSRHIEQAKAHARAIVPYGDGSDGGHLRDCIFSHVKTSPGHVMGTLYALNPHAAHVEMGTSRTPAQPYLRPAIRLQKDNFISALRK